MDQPLQEDERGASDILDSLGLGKVLQELGVGGDSSAEAFQKLGLGAKRVDALRSEHIYNEAYEDDDGGLDLGKLPDEERRNSDLANAGAIERYHQAGLSLLPTLASQTGRDEPDPSTTLRELLPAFHEQDALDFTDLFNSARPHKKRRLGAVKANFSSSSRPDTELSLLERPKPVPSIPKPDIAHLVSQVQRSWERPVASSVRLFEALHDPSLNLDAWSEGLGSSHAVQPSRGLKDPELEWEGRIRWSMDRTDTTVDLVMDLNDPGMIFEEQAHLSVVVSHGSEGLTHRAARVAASMNPLNLSNDRFYEVPREHRQKVRQTLGQLVVQHARPAVKLQLPFYKTRLSKKEVQSFHRPAMQFPINIAISPSKVQSTRKRREDRGKVKKGKDPAEILTSTRDLTLRDASTFVLYEYAEEHPIVLSNIGMGHLLVNYYRKKSNRDESMPKSDIGESFVLDVSDESPFMGFGQVDSGQVQPTLYNNMVRAPLFRQKARSGDFLLIRHTTKSDASYHLRELTHVFTVGQLLPTVLVPGPHARLATNAMKTRLHMITHKLLQRSKGERIKIHRLMRYFPDQNELQMRQRLKEFMEYNRRAGDVDQGFWKLKQGIVPPSEEELFKQLPPEHMALCESMQAGQQRLVDAGFQNADDNIEDDADADTGMEQSIAPWTASKNFLNGAAGKAMLALHGEGDPSGRGDAFSFIRVSMKEVFVAASDDVEEKRAAAEAQASTKSGHRYNVAQQQQVYRNEIARIWKQQKAALSNPNPPSISKRDLVPMQRSKRTYAAEVEILKASQTRDDAEDTSVNETDLGTVPKVMCIRRQRAGKWYTEIVREKAVIDAYSRQRHTAQDAQTATEALVPTGDALLDAARQKRLANEIAQLEKNQDRRLQRKQAQAVAEGQSFSMPKLNKTTTKRVCGRCGQVGHMSTNTSCPLFGKAGVETGRAGSPLETAPGRAGSPPTIVQHQRMEAVSTSPGVSPAADPTITASGSKIKLKLKRT